MLAVMITVVATGYTLARLPLPFSTSGLTPHHDPPSGPGSELRQTVPAWCWAIPVPTAVGWSRCAIDSVNMHALKNGNYPWQSSKAKHVTGNLRFLSAPGLRCGSPTSSSDPATA